MTKLCPSVYMDMQLHPLVVKVLAIKFIIGTRLKDSEGIKAISSDRLPIRCRETSRLIRYLYLQPYPTTFIHGTRYR